MHLCMAGTAGPYGRLGESVYLVALGHRRCPCLVRRWIHACIYASGCCSPLQPAHPLLSSGAHRLPILSQGPQGCRTLIAAPGLWAATGPQVTSGASVSSLEGGAALHPLTARLCLCPRALGPPEQKVPEAAAQELPAAPGGDRGEPALSAGQAAPPESHRSGLAAAAAWCQSCPAGPQGVRRRGEGLSWVRAWAKVWVEPGVGLTWGQAYLGWGSQGLGLSGLGR